MGLTTETPQETMERLGAEPRLRATTQVTAGQPQEGRPSRARVSRDSHLRLRLALTVVVGSVALVVGGTGLFHAVEMSRYGEVVTAEVLSVETAGRGSNTVNVEYQMDGVVYRGQVSEWWTAPDPGDTTDVVYDTRNVTHITDAPLAADYLRSTLAVAFGAWLLIKAGRDFSQNRAAFRGSQWLPD